MTRARATSQAVSWPVNVETTAAADIEATDTRKTYTNVGSALDTTFSLPVAAAGLEFRFVRVATQWIRLLPDGTEIVGGGTAGQYLEMQTDGSVVHLKAFTTGIWSMMSATGTIAYG